VKLDSNFENIIAFAMVREPGMLQVRSHQYQFNVIDVGRDREAYRRMIEISDQDYVPTLVAGDEVLSNFDTAQLKKFLSEHGIEP